MTTPIYHELLTRIRDTFPAPVSDRLHAAPLRPPGHVVPEVIDAANGEGSRAAALCDNAC